MEVFRVQVGGGDQQAARLLEDPPHGVRIDGPVFLGLVEVKTQTGSETHCANHGVVCCTVLVRHDARVGRIFVDKDVVGFSMGAIRKDMPLLLLRFVIVTAIK